MRQLAFGACKQCHEFRLSHRTFVPGEAHCMLRTLQEIRVSLLCVILIRATIFFQSASERWRECPRRRQRAEWAEYIRSRLAAVARQQSHLRAQQDDQRPSSLDYQTRLRTFQGLTVSSFIRFTLRHFKSSGSTDAMKRESKKWRMPGRSQVPT